MAPFRQPLPLYKQSIFCLTQFLNSVCLENKLASENPSWISAIQHLQGILPGFLQTQVGDAIIDEMNKLQRPPHPSLVELLLVLRSSKLCVGGSVVQSGVLDFVDGAHLDKLWLHYCGNGDKAARLHSFLQTATNLTHLYCTDFCNDEMLQIISNTCHHLYCLDLRVCDVTNDGILSLCGLNYNLSQCLNFLSNGVILEPLSRCSQSLREIKLSMTKVTEAGIAIILLILKDIHLLRVPDIKMEQGFNFIKSLGQDGVHINLREFHSREKLDDIQLNVLAYICPNLEYVQVSFLGNFEDDSKRIMELTRLKNLSRAKFADVDCDALELFLQEMGHKMRHLHVYIHHGSSSGERAKITRSHLNSLPSYCPNLESFCLNGYFLEEDQTNISHRPTADYFKSLKAFTITSMKLGEEDLKIFLAKSRNMKELQINLTSPHALNDGFISELLDKGVWRNLERMLVLNSTITSKLINRLLQECPYLQDLGCLNTWFVTKSQVVQIKDIVRERNLAVDIR